MERTGTAALLLAGILCLLLAGCAHGAASLGAVQTPPQAAATADWGDPLSDARLDMSSETAKAEARVLTFVDGDTTHFRVEGESRPVKVRYLAVNTPETTGKVEPWGKKAAALVRDRLSGASSILIESDGPSWENDSTGSRRLGWVWYRAKADGPWRNLNIEILQNGLAVASSSANNRYGRFCMAALGKAKAERLNIFSGGRDPDFYYGEAIELSLKELRLHPEEYLGKKVAFEATVSLNGGQTVYVEDQDPETGLWFGMPVYYGYNLPGAGLAIIGVGHRCRIVGTLQFYEAGRTLQVSGLGYRVMRPDDPDNLRLISEGHRGVFQELRLEDLFQEVQVDGSPRTLSGLLEGTTVSLRGLEAASALEDERGVVRILCRQDGREVLVMAHSLKDRPESLVGKTIDVRGVVGSFAGNCEVLAYGSDSIVVN